MGFNNLTQHHFVTPNGVARFLDFTVKRNEIRLYPTQINIRVLELLLNLDDPKYLLKAQKTSVDHVWRYTEETRDAHAMHPLVFTNIIESKGKNPQSYPIYGLTDWGRSALMSLKAGYVWSSLGGPLPDITRELYRSLEEKMSAGVDEVEMPLKLMGSWWYGLETHRDVIAYTTTAEQIEFHLADIISLQQSQFAIESGIHDSWAKSLVLWRLEAV